MAKNSTDYYRENKTSRKVVHYCPHCHFSTTYGKCVLHNHIYARHTPESDRPFQCTHCTRGFAQKAHLISHLDKVHNISDAILNSKISTLLYIISPSDTAPKSYKTRARLKYYKDNPVLKSRDIHENKHEYLANVYLRNHDIHYDHKHKFISMSKLPLRGGTRTCRRPVVLRT